MASTVLANYPVSNNFRLLSPSNPKINKGRSAGYWTFILHLSPARLSGFNTCPMATAGCKAACLNTAGRGGIAAGHGILTEQDVIAGKRNSIQTARIRKTRLFFTDRANFMAVLVADIEKAIRLAKAKGYTPVFRLNGTSDIRWESIACRRTMKAKPAAHELGDVYPSLMAAFPEVQFYDYTKIANRRNVPRNYALTFSLADGNEEQAIAALDNGMNVAAVFRNQRTVQELIAGGWMYLGRPVFGGDDSDLRFLDPRHHVIALYAKGNAKRDTSGFVRDL
jgi:hypothetical protein